MKKPNHRPGVGPTLCLALLLVVLAGGLAYLLLFTPFKPQMMTPAPPQPTTQPTTLPPPIVTASGQPQDPACREHYTVGASEARPEQVAATAGNRKLTNEALQIHYLNTISAFQKEQRSAAPDFSQPLEEQPCPLAEGLSWQHYFLKLAISGWAAQQAVLQAADQPQYITEEAFKPDEFMALHAEHIAPELPVNGFLYQNTPRFQPNKLHQAYLDGLGDTLDTLARQAGAGSLGVLAGQAGVSADAWLQAAKDYNLAYMYYTEMTYSLDDPTQASMKALWDQWLRAAGLTCDYSAVQLWADTTRVYPCLEDTLYPDIAHERFPEPIVYLQQDYHTYPYGSGTVGANGCGITTFAMLATYMTDTLQTPAMMAKEYVQYFDGSGTDGKIFLEVPPKMGFAHATETNDLEAVIRALQNGQVVINRQGNQLSKSNFTSAGHYLLLSNYYPETDSFQVRDSNIYNYGKLPGHKIDRFTREYLMSGSEQFYIISAKIVTDPACSRCGTGTGFLCQRCTDALARRKDFLSLLGSYTGL